jgi:hypothetical protein
MTKAFGGFLPGMGVAYLVPSVIRDSTSTSATNTTYSVGAGRVYTN